MKKNLWAPLLISGLATTALANLPRGSLLYVSKDQNCKIRIEPVMWGGSQEYDIALDVVNPRTVFHSESSDFFVLRLDRSDVAVFANQFDQIKLVYSSDDTSGKTLAAMTVTGAHPVVCQELRTVDQPSWAER